MLFRRQQTGSDVGGDEARANSVDADVGRRKFAGHRLGQTENAGLGGGVMRAAENAAATLGRDR
jgi:hypothetical protein